MVCHQFLHSIHSAELLLRWSDSERQRRTRPQHGPAVHRNKMASCPAEPWDMAPELVDNVHRGCPGPRWLDGRTQNGTVGLAPTRSAPFTGTRWEIARWTGPDYPPNLVFFKCLGDVPGPRWLTGYPKRSPNGTVGLSDNHSLWSVRVLPQ